MARPGRGRGRHTHRHRGWNRRLVHWRIHLPVDWTWRAHSALELHLRAHRRGHSLADIAGVLGPAHSRLAPRGKALGVYAS